MVDDGRASRIVANLGPLMLVTTPRHQVDVIITEYGAAELRGAASPSGARALVEIAHPDFRAELEAAAAQMT